VIDNKLSIALRNALGAHAGAAFSLPRVGSELREVGVGDSGSNLHLTDAAVREPP
jgi:hypothetical protein